MTVKCFGCGDEFVGVVGNATGALFCPTCHAKRFGYTQQEGEGMKATNPKDAIGSSKIPFHLWPETATIYGSLGLLDGMLKYGRMNWRPAGVKFSIYFDAMRRHMNKINEGEWTDPDSGLPHLCHVGACWAIITDAYAAGQLTMDTNFPGGYVETVAAMTPHVERLKKLHAEQGHAPHHWTRADVEDKE